MNNISIKAKNVWSRIINKKIINTPHEYSGALCHITHGKAGSQWIYKILNHCASYNIVAPGYGNAQVLNASLLPQKIYPTLFVTREKFYSFNLPCQSTYFVIIRDLRDTLISAYFSAKISHVVDNETVVNYRKILNELNSEDGLIYLIQDWLPICANIQQSWLSEKKKIIKYEDLLKSDVEILLPIILPHLKLPKEEVERIILFNRFEALTQGRKRGEEDVTSHERKGIVGDWKNYFTDRVKKEFKSKFGKLLIKTGYERDNNW